MGISVLVRRHLEIETAPKIYRVDKGCRMICIVAIMMTSSNENIFHVTGPIWGEFTGRRGFPLTKASDTKLVLFTFAWTNGWVNNRNAGDLRRHPAHYDVIVKMKCKCLQSYLIHSTTVRVTHVMTHNLSKFQISTTISCPMLLNDKGLYKDSWYPWRSGGINDARNVLNASVMDSF